MLFVHIFIGNLSYSTTDQTISVTRREVFVPTSSLSNSTGETLSYKSSSFSMPLQKHKTWSILSRGFKKKGGKEMKRGVTVAVSSCHRLSQAFGIPAFSLHLQAKFQCFLPAAKFGWWHSCASGKSHGSGTVVAWPQHWVPWWVRPSLGDTPVWPALHRVLMPAK